MKIPNLLTIIRFALIPLIAAMMYSSSPAVVALSIAVFLFAVFTDWADGHIARKYDLKSAFGTFFDPLADKMLILTVFFIFSDLKIIPVWLALLVLFRELLVTGVRQVCSTPKKIVGANWMGKSKFAMQTLSVIFMQIVLYLKVSEVKNIVFSEAAAFYVVLAVTLVSLAYAFNFVWWYRKEIMNGI